MDIGAKSGRFGGCEGFMVGWASGLTPCYLCEQNGGPVECCIRCGQQAHVREQVYVGGVEGFGHHVVHEGVRWVSVDANGEAEIQYCNRVHVGRWVGGMCQMCCCEVASVRIDTEGGGWLSEVVRDRIRVRDELVAANIESTRVRGAGHSRTGTRRGGAMGADGFNVGRSGQLSAGSTLSGGMGTAVSSFGRGAGAAEMDICSGTRGTLC